jgi:hypothetical protein
MYESARCKHGVNISVSCFRCADERKQKQKRDEITKRIIERSKSRDW